MKLYKGNVTGKVYRLVYELNKDNRIRVRTPVGDSEVRETGETVQQGSILGGILSSLSLGKGVEDFFSSSEWEIFYDSLKILPLVFQDDLFRMSLDPLSAQMGFDKFQSLAESKVLDYNLTKTFCIIVGKRKAREKLEKDFRDNPPTLYGKEVQIVSHESYLGEELGGSISDSITLTINKRIGLVKKAITEIKSIVEDCRSQVVGSIKTGIMLYELCVLPFLLNHASTWLQIKQSDLKRLIKLDCLFYNSLLGVKNCPAMALFWETGALVMPIRILKSKLLLYHHLSCLPMKSPAHQVLQIQEKLGLPSLRDEIVEFLRKFEVVEVSTFSKDGWKKFVREKSTF